MNHIRIFTFSILFLLTFSSFCQVDLHFVKYKYSDRTDFPRVNQQFFIKEVIDSRDDSTTIGVVQKGMFNKRVNANFEKSAKEYFEKLGFDSKYAINFDGALLPVYIEVKEININEWTSVTSEKGMIDLNLNFYKKSENNELNLLFQTEVYLESGGMDVTGSHFYRINEAFLKSLSKLNDYLIQGKTSQIGGANNTQLLAAYSDDLANLDQFLKNENISKLSYSTVENDDDNLLKATKIRPGVYVTFKDLIKNRPVFNENYDIEYLVDNSKLKLRTLKKNKIIRQKFWAVSDGKNLYINSKLYNPISNFYTKVMHFGTLLIWNDNVYDANDAAVQAGFGLIGVAINNSIKKGDCIFIDTRTGVLNHANPTTLKLLFKDSPKLLDAYDRLDHKRNAENLINLLVTYNHENPISK